MSKELTGKELMEEIADFLGATREYIEKNGWWRGGLVGPNGKQRCVLGAMYGTLRYDFRRSMPDKMNKTCIYLVNYLATQPTFTADTYGQIPGIPRTINSVDEWNDRFAKDKQDVLDTLAKAEKIARAGFDPDA